MTAAYHVYAVDGYESCHRSLAAAVHAAKRGAKRRRVTYTVVQCDAHGLTGGVHGTTVATLGAEAS